MNAPPFPAARPRPGGWLIATLLGQLAFGLLAMTICIPSMQQWGAIFGTAQSNVQLTFSVYVLCYGGAQLVHGPMSDRHGRRKVLIIGLALAAAGSALAALAPDLLTLTLARAVQGAGAAAGMVVGRAMINDLFEGAERTRMMAWVGMAMGLCPPLATVIGGQLHVRLGWQANFVVMTLLALGLIAATWRLLPAGPAPAQPAPQGRGLAGTLRNFALLLRDPSLRAHVLLLSMATAAFYAFLGAAPLVLGSYGLGPDRVGLVIMVAPLSYIAGNFVTTRLAHRMGSRRLMVAGQAITLAGMVLLLALALGGMKTPLALALPLTLLGVGHGLLVPPALAGTVSLAPAMAGAAAGLAGLSQQLSGAFAGYVVGWFTHDDARHMAWLMLAFSLAGAAAQAALHRHQARTAAGSSG